MHKKPPEHGAHLCRPWCISWAAALCLLLPACAERPLIGVTVTNSPDTLPCAPGKSCR